VPTAKKSRSVPAIGQMQRSEESSESDTSSSEDDVTSDGEEFDDDGLIVLRRSTRTAAVTSRGKVVRDLPFSPKKTRFRTRAALMNEDSNDELAGYESSARPARRSTRTRKGGKTNLADADAYEDDEDEDEDEDDDEDDSDNFTIRNKTKPHIKARRGKASRPAYGNIRDVADLAYDPQEDPQTAALRAHRDFCEKCQRKPTHELLIALRKRPKGRGRKKKTSDDEDEGVNEEDRLVAMGGWVRW
jgi:chromodomain-helicase-DNA-binding protein 4